MPWKNPLPPQWAHRVPGWNRPYKGHSILQKCRGVLGETHIEIDTRKHLLLPFRRRQKVSVGYTCTLQGVHTNTSRWLDSMLFFLTSYFLAMKMVSQILVRVRVRGGGKILPIGNYLAHPTHWLYMIYQLGYCPRAPVWWTCVLFQAISTPHMVSCFFQ